MYRQKSLRAHEKPRGPKEHTQKRHQTALRTPQNGPPQAPKIHPPRRRQTARTTHQNTLGTTVRTTINVALSLHEILMQRTSIHTVKRDGGKNNLPRNWVSHQVRYSRY